MVEGRHGWARRHAGALVAVGVALTLVLGSALALVRHLDHNVSRVDVSRGIGTDRPSVAPRATEAVNILLVGSDTRVGAGNDRYGKVAQEPGAHSDTNLLVHLSADRSWATVVSIPRDSMTLAPPDCSPTAPTSQWVMRQWNHNYTIGGMGCLIRTLEGNTGIYVNHYAVVDFNGFKEMVDALGGVSVCTEEPINDSDSTLVLAPGRHELSGEQALAYVRTRKSVGDGSDIGRIGRQQAFLASIAQEATSSKMLFRPTRLYSFLDAATRSLTTDPGLDLATMASIAEGLRGIGLQHIEFATPPWENYAADPNRVVWTSGAERIWQSLREDRPLRSSDEEPASAGPSPSAEPLTVSPDRIQVTVENATGASGLATQVAAALRVQGFTATTRNAPGVTDGVVVEYSGGRAEAARTVAAALPGSTIRQRNGLGATVRVVVGRGARPVVEVPNRLGTGPLPGQPITAPAIPGTEDLVSRTAQTSICG